MVGKQATKFERVKLISSLIYFTYQEETEELISKFKSLLNELEDVDSVRDKNDSNNTLLHKAVTSGNLRLVTLLLERGASITAENDEGETPLSLSEIASLEDECSSKAEINHLLFGIEVEHGGIGSLEKTINGNFKQDYDTIVVKEEVLKKLNRPCESDGNTLLMKFSRRGQADVVEFLLKCNGLEVDSVNVEKETAAEIAWQEKNYTCLLRLLEADSLFPCSIDEKKVEEARPGGKQLKEFLDQRKKLHELIKLGDLKSVEDLAKRQKSSLYLSTDNISAVSCAIENKKLDVFACLLSLGAKFKNDREEKESIIDQSQYIEMEKELDKYFVSYPNSHVYKLIGASKVLGKFTSKRMEIVEDLFHYLNGIKLVCLIMKTLEYESVEVIFDFESERIERLYHTQKGEIFGLADPSIQRVYIGAKGCIHGETTNRKVAGTMAHELCHIAIGAIYVNNALPYGKNDTKRKTKYENIVHTTGKYLDLNYVISRVFKYTKLLWGAELIVRVPHILAQYGESEGEKILQSQVPELFQFYLDHVAPECENYIKDGFFKRPLCFIHPIYKFKGCVRDIEKGIFPFSRSLTSFRNYLIPYGNISVLVSSNIKLCAMHVQAELKEIYLYHMERRCYFFDLGWFSENHETFVNPLKGKSCEYIVLLSKEKDPDLIGLSKIFEWNVKKEKKEVIVILNSQCNKLDEGWKSNVLEFNWDDLSEPFKKELLRKRVEYYGEEVSLEKVVDEKTASEMFDSEMLSCLMTEERIQVGDRDRLFSPGYNEECYSKRSFVREIFLDGVFEDDDHEHQYFFITGLSKEKLREELMEKGMVQTIEKGDEDLFKDRKIILPAREENARDVFENICQKNPTASFHWLHFEKNSFYCRTSKGKMEIKERYRMMEEIDEETLIETTNKNMERVVLISGDAGSGKSIVLSDLIRKMKGTNAWLGRVNLNSFSGIHENPRSLSNVQEGAKKKDVVDYFFRILHLQNPFELCLVKGFLRRDCKVKVFMDGFHAVNPNYKKNALTLMRILKKETRIQMWVTTRNHERMDLEGELEVCSHAMKPFSFEEQERYLDKFWKHSLKSSILEVSEHSNKESVEKFRRKSDGILAELKKSFEQHEDRKIVESFKVLAKSINDEGHGNDVKIKQKNWETIIQELDFIPYAQYFLYNMTFSKNEKEKLSMGLPFNLRVLAEVSYHYNLRIRDLSDMYHIYSELIEIKFETFMEEEFKYAEVTQSTIEWNKTIREKLPKFHRRIAMSVMHPKRYPSKPIKESHVGKYMQVGLLTNEEGHFQFIHRSLAEYFFGDFILEGISEDRLEKGLLKDVILEPGYESVRNFIDYNFQSKKMLFGENFIKEFDVVDVFNRCRNHEEKEVFQNCRNIWEGVIRSVEQHSNEDSMYDFISTLVEASERVEEAVKMKFFMLLHNALSDVTLSRFFNSIEFVREYIFSLISRESAEDLKEVLEAMKRYLCHEACLKSGKRSLITSRRLNTKEIDGVLKKIKEPYGVEQGKRLLEVRDKKRRNVFHRCCRNEDENVFPLLMGFFKEIVGEGVLSELITKRDGVNRSILHVCAIWHGFPRIRLILNQIRVLLTEKTFEDLMMGVDIYGRNFLFQLAVFKQDEEMKQALDYLNDCVGSLLMKKMLLQRDVNKYTVLHTAAGNEDIAAFQQILKAARSCMIGEEFKELVMSGNKRGLTIFHRRATEEQPLRDLRILEEYISREQLRELLRMKDDNGETCLHLLLVLRKRKVSQDVVVDDLRFLSEVLDRTSLEEFLLGTNNNGDTFLHYAAKNENIKDYCEILGELKNILPGSSYKKLLDTQNDDGEAVEVYIKGGAAKLRTKYFQ